MKNIFNTKQEYLDFIKNWKEFVKSGGAKNSPHTYMIYNILKGRDKLHGFNIIKAGTLYRIANLLAYEKTALRFNLKDTSIIKKLLNMEGTTSPTYVIDYISNLVSEIVILADQKAHL